MVLFRELLPMRMRNLWGDSKAHLKRSYQRASLQLGAEETTFLSSSSMLVALLNRGGPLQCATESIGGNTVLNRARSLTGVDGGGAVSTRRQLPDLLWF